MINPDDLESPSAQTKPRDLQQLSVEELEEYIAALQDEIARADAMIAKKKTHRDGIEALFGKQS